ncbi:hypothetical protein B0H14DRAFT_2593769 [Mycena olivaceomarginata]|nr:hypothetical protein B0H14DRAFT_2593769 [Mycena olivaceomarginata]
MCKRAGRGHDPGGISATKPGELAIPCRACPHPNINLPLDWADVPAEVVDTAQSSRDKDPTLGPGWAYMVASDGYLKFLAQHIHEDEISHCVSFAALWSANNKHAKGLRASGVGSVSCSQHEMFHPLGMGDLQRGERYANMDYIWFSSLMGTILLTIIASYDIACQWGIHFWSQVQQMLEHLKLPDWVQVIFKVPKFHLPPHIKRCHSPFSFNYTKGVGRTDSEGVERNWSWFNSAARSVSVMGPGSREDTIDDLCGFSNWKKTVDLGKSLLRKMVLAIPEAMLHSRAFHLFTTRLRDGHEADLSKWEKMVRDWERDSENEDPYQYAEVKAVTMADVLARIAEEEHQQVTREGASALTVKPGPFLIEGIEIQESQSALRLEVKHICRTTIQATALQRSQTLLLSKVEALNNVQDTYMPRLCQWIAEKTPPLPVGSNTKPETIPIYLLSSILADARPRVCPSALVEQEALRSAQADQVLCQLQAGLRTRIFAHCFKCKHLGGQGAYTKSRDLLDAIKDRIQSAALRELKQEDIWGMSEQALNDEEKEENRKARLLAGLPAKAEGGDVDKYDIQVEWTKARRVLEFFTWKARWWDERVDLGRDVSPEVAEGLRAYALVHAAQERAWESDWRRQWAAVRDRAKAVMHDHIVDVMELVCLEVELEELDEEEDGFDDFKEENES